MPVFFGRDRPGVFYVHVPKTGGTHIEQLFQANDYRRSFWAPRAYGLICSPQHFHRAIWEPFANPDGFGLSFITVRHPVDRLISQYRDVMELVTTEVALEAWLSETADRLVADPYLQDNHLRPQWEFHHPDLEVFRQEDGFDAAWAGELSMRYGLGFNPVAVESRRPPRPSGVPLRAAEQRAVLAFCERFYTRDFDTFGYDPGDARVLRPVD